MIVDLLAHLICFYFKPIPWRYDVICHHSFAYSVIYLMEYPVPLYGWMILCTLLLTETSTIFMNLRWFAKHFGYSPQILYRLNALFIITWFGVRVPCILTIQSYLLYYWNVIFQVAPQRTAVSAAILCFSITTLHVIWAYCLILKLRKNNKKKTDYVSANVQNNKSMIESPDQLNELQESQSLL